MRKLLVSLVLILLIAIFSGFTIKEHLNPILEDPSTQTIQYMNGNRVIFSFLGNSSIGILGFREQSGDLIFNIACKNSSNEPINFIPEDITATGTNKSGKEFSLQVYSALDYVKKIKTKQQWKLAGKALIDASETMNAGTTTTTSSGSGSYYGSDGYGSVYGSSTSSTYDSGKVSEVNRKNQVEYEKMKDQFNKEIKDLYKVLLKDNT